LQEDQGAKLGWIVKEIDNVIAVAGANVRGSRGCRVWRTGELPGSQAVLCD
jgi:hypothetical protein